MTRSLVLAVGAGVLAATSAHAGGIERSPQSVGLLFEEGRLVQFSFGMVAPTLEGTFGPGLSSGDMAPSYSTLNLGYKMPLGERMDVAVIFDQSVGADVDYTGADPGYPFLGTTAELNGSDITALLRYRLDGGFSVYGGLRAQSITATLDGLFVPGAPGPYALDVDRTWELGYVAGVAYERPDIALRVALTYNSAIDHDFDSTESFGAVSLPDGNFSITIPQSVNLEFQTGIAADTLLFGSVRWQEWSAFDITPPGLGGASLIDYESDYTTWTLGVGRRFSETWSGAITLGYEGETGDVQGNLAPRDGFASIGLAATYTAGNAQITGGVRYIALGDATTQTIGARFENNDALAAGIQVKYRF
jgi:long-chain fatty acid transport protein